MREDYYTKAGAACCEQSKQLTEEKVFETMYARLVERVSDLDYHSNEIFFSVCKLRNFELSPRKEVDQKSTDVIGNFAIKIDELSVIKEKLIQIDNVLKLLV